MTKYWAFRCQVENCALCNDTSCLVSIDEMPIPQESEGYCWITNDIVIWKLEEMQE